MLLEDINVICFTTIKKKDTGFYLSVKSAVESMIDKKLSEGLSKWFLFIF